MELVQNMLSPMMKFKLFQLATKYGINIHRFEPGYVQAYIMRWKEYQYQLNRMIEKVKQYPEVRSIHFSEQTNLISIEYDETMFNDQSAIEYWLSILEQELGH